MLERIHSTIDIVIDFFEINRSLLQNKSSWRSNPKKWRTGMSRDLLWELIVKEIEEVEKETF